jgi:hypothetical protein
MTTIARITAIILIVLGILVMLGGVATAVGGILRSGQHITAAAVQRPAGLINGFALALLIFAQGIIVIASGEGLYLLAALARKMPPT